MIVDLIRIHPIYEKELRQLEFPSHKKKEIVHPVNPQKVITSTSSRPPHDQQFLNTMKFNTLPISSGSLITLCTAASASAWSCGPSPRVIGNRYNVGCSPNEICGPSSTDFLTMPEIQAMLRRSRSKQRYFYRPFLDEFRTSMDMPFGTTTFPPWKTRSNKQSTLTTSVSPRYDIIESDSNIQLAIDVPGVEMDNISILLDDQAKVLTVSGSRAQSTTSRFGTDERDDRSDLPTSSRTFSQKFVLKNPTIDINHISASLENGVLTVTLPKISPEETVKDKNVRQIPIMSTKSASSATTTDDNIAVDDGNDPLVADKSESVAAMSEDVDDPLPDGKSDQSKNRDPPDSDDIGKDNK
jgi:HSP20 family molecular chaperone IbpA